MESAVVPNGEPPVIDRLTPIDRLPSMLRVEEVARWSGVSRGVIYDACRQGSLKSVAFGRILRIPRTELERWIGNGNGQGHE